MGARDLSQTMKCENFLSLSRVCVGVRGELVLAPGYHGEDEYCIQRIVFVNLLFVL